MSLWPAWTLLAAVPLLAGCAHALDDRWAAANYVETSSFRAALDDSRFADPSAARGTDPAGPQVSVYTYPTPASGPGAVALRDLADHGQQAYIEALAGLGGKGDSLRAALAKPLGGGGAAPSSTDSVREQTRFDRTLVVSVSKGLRSPPGDRLMRTVVEIVPDDQFQFAGYKVVATDTKTLNVEHLDQKTEASIQASVSPKLAGSLAGGGSLSGGVTDTRESSADIAPSYENLDVEITPKMLRITRESERNLDLTGNTIVALSMLARPDAPALGAGERYQLASAPLLYKAEKPLPPAQASVALTRLQTLAPCPVTAWVRMLYQLRHIETGAAHYVEGGQRVSIVSDATKPALENLIEAEDLTGPLYGIAAAGAGAQRYIEAGNRDATLRLVFADYASARDMARWMLATKARSIGRDGVHLLLGGDPMPARYPGMLIAKRVDRPASPAQCATLNAGASSP